MSIFADFCRNAQESFKKSREVIGGERTALVKEALALCFEAIRLPDSEVHPLHRAEVAELARTIESNHRAEVLAAMPEEDRTLILSALMSEPNRGKPWVSLDPALFKTDMFAIARIRLGIGIQTELEPYRSDTAPEPVRDIMVPFLDGAISKEETKKRLEKADKKLKYWIPRLYPGLEYLSK